MFRPLRRVSLVAALLIMGTSVAAAPAGANTPTNGFGSKVRCHNTTISTAPHERELRRLVVFPPEPIDDVHTGANGWRFIVRRLNFNTNRWSVTYRSPVQKAPDDSAFTSMAVKVVVPRWPSLDSQEAHLYRVVIKRYSYRPDGSIRDTAKSAVYDGYRVWIDGAFAYRESGGCYGRNRIAPE